MSAPRYLVYFGGLGDELELLELDDGGGVVVLGDLGDVGDVELGLMVLLLFG